MRTCLRLELPAASEADLHEALVGMMHWGGFAMHDTRRCSDNISPEHLPYALMTHAHPEDGEICPKFLDSL